MYFAHKDTGVPYSRFSQMHNIGNKGNIAISLFPYIYSFFLYSNVIRLVNVEFDIARCKRITFQGWMLWWSSKFSMTQ